MGSEAGNNLGNGVVEATMKAVNWGKPDRLIFPKIAGSFEKIRQNSEQGTPDLGFFERIDERRKIIGRQGEKD
ncbi:MAG: hypothetical protein UX84_C0015G0003 [Microgenomates group bacterium GW2011_GWD1_47_13]|nr:MAG: hypothetical protein UX84_C0015G0003 [Microgenomates group bacterium GW2011_GWD1_47_13]